MAGLRTWGMALGLGGALWLGQWAAVAAEAPPPFRGLVVFGDSLSDTGNAVLAREMRAEARLLSPPAGRFSNGAVWVDRIAERLGVPLVPALAGGTNFAFGGARTTGPGNPFSLRTQADRFLAARPPAGAGPQALYVIAGGANDLLGALDSPDPTAVVGPAVAALRGIIADLAAAGAIDILVLNLPDLGRTPEVRRRGPAAVETARVMVLAFNDELEQALRGLEAAHRIRLHRLDVFTLLERIAADPGAAGFANITEPCLSGLDPGGPTVCAEPDRYLFWDALHPTEAAHARLAAAALQAVAADAAPAVTGGQAPASEL